MSEPVKSVKYCYCQIKLSPCYFKLVFPQLPDFYLSRLIDIQDKEQRYSRLFEKFGIWKKYIICNYLWIIENLIIYDWLWLIKMCDYLKLDYSISWKGDHNTYRVSHKRRPVA